MKSLVLASALGTLAGAFAVPLLSGPIHLAVTKPHSMFAWLPAGPVTQGPVSVTVGVAPTAFVVTDVLLGQAAGVERVVITANGTPIFCMAGAAGHWGPQGSTHLNTGILLPGGATIVVEATSSAPIASPITLAGYVY